MAACNTCGRNLITELTSAASPRVDISSTCKVGQKLGVSLPLLTCSPSAWPSRLLYRRGRKTQRDLRTTLYFRNSNVHRHPCRLTVPIWPTCRLSASLRNDAIRSNRHRKQIRIIHTHVSSVVTIYPAAKRAYSTSRISGMISAMEFMIGRMCQPDRLCGLVVKLSGYRYRGLGFDSRRNQIFRVVVGLERGPLSLVSSIEELLE